MYFYSDTVLFTGSNKGVVKRWNLAGNEPPKKETSKDKQTSRSRDSYASTNSSATINGTINGTSFAPSRFIDYYFMEQTEKVRLLERKSFVSSSPVRKSTVVREETELATKPTGVLERVIAQVKNPLAESLKLLKRGSTTTTVEDTDNSQLSSYSGDSEALLTDDNTVKVTRNST